MIVINKVKYAVHRHRTKMGWLMARTARLVCLLVLLGATAKVPGEEAALAAGT
jgi:hypothetical protein